MFAALAFDRPPLQYEDVPGGFLSWVQDAGGFAAVGLLTWFLLRFVMRQPADRSRKRPRWESVLFLLAVVVAGLAYALYFVLKLPEMWAWMRGNPSTAAGPTRLQTWALSVGGAAALVAVTLPFFMDLVRMRWRRIFALAKLSFKEALRRRVLWVFSALLLVFLFGSWFLPYEELKPEDQVRNYITVIYWAMTPMLLLVASLIAAFSIPTDIKQQTIHTILTKPVERFEIILGRILGYTLLMSVVLFVMTGFSLIYVARGVSPEAAYESFKARVPLYGELAFEGTDDDRRGGNVGKEWDYRGY